jgi:hypothetical protein
MTSLAALSFTVFTLCGCGDQRTPTQDESRPGQQPAKKGQALAAQTTSLTGAAAAVVEAANLQIHAFLNTIPDGTERELGFKQRDEFSLAEVGMPYEMFQLSEAGETAPLDYWRVPVVVDDHYRAMLDVRQLTAGWTVVGVGAAQLARELQFHEQGRAKLAADATIRSRAILRVFALTSDIAAYDCDLRSVDQLDQCKLRALASAQIAFGRKLIAALGAAASNPPQTWELTIDQVRSLIAQ